MFDRYINHLLTQAQYIKDESGYVFVRVPWHQGFFSQGEDVEQARENLIDAIEGILFLKLQNRDQQLINEMKQFIPQQEVEYA